MPFVLHFKTVCQTPRQSPAFPVFSGEVAQPCSCRRVCDPTPPPFFFSVCGVREGSVLQSRHGSMEASPTFSSCHDTLLPQASGSRPTLCICLCSELLSTPLPCLCPRFVPTAGHFPDLPSPSLALPPSLCFFFFSLSLPSLLPSLAPRVYTCSSDPYKPNPVPSIHKRDSLLFMGDFRAHWFSAQ